MVTVNEYTFPILSAGKYCSLLDFPVIKHCFDTFDDGSVNVCWDLLFDAKFIGMIPSDQEKVRKSFISKMYANLFATYETVFGTTPVIAPDRSAGESNAGADDLSLTLDSLADGNSYRGVIIQPKDNVTYIYNCMGFGEERSVSVNIFRLSEGVIDCCVTDNLVYCRSVGMANPITLKNDAFFYGFISSSFRDSDMALQAQMLRHSLYEVFSVAKASVDDKSARMTRKGETLITRDGLINIDTSVHCKLLCV